MESNLPYSGKFSQDHENLHNFPRARGPAAERASISRIISRAQPVQSGHDYSKMAGLASRVEELLVLLDEVERGIQQEPDSLQHELASRLVDKLQRVAKVVTDSYVEQPKGTGSSLFEPDGNQKNMTEDGSQVEDGQPDRMEVTFIITQWLESR